MTGGFQKCTVCNGPAEVLFKAKPLDYCLNKSFEIWRCASCGLGRTGGVTKSDLTSVYEDGAYEPKENRWHRTFRPFLNILEKSKLRYLRMEGKRGAKVLEVGAGKGNFLVAAIHAGYDAIGIEPSTRSYNMAKAKLGKNIFQCGLEQIRHHVGDQNKFDFIILWHVLEHLGDPEDSIDRLKTLLAPNGSLILAVPNFGSYQRILGRKNWYHLDPPRHLFHYSPKSITQLLKKKGMYPSKIVHGSLFQNWLGEIITISNLILPLKNILLNVLRKNRFFFAQASQLKIFLNLIGFLVVTTLILLPSFLLCFFGQAMGRAGTMVVVARSK